MKREMTVVVSLLLIVLLLPPGRSVSIDGTATTATVSIAVYPSNASHIDLSNQGLEGRLVLTFHAENPNDAAASTKPTQISDWRKVTIETLNLSGNLRLTSFSIDVASGKSVDDLYIEIGKLDIGGTQMAPLPGRLFQPVQTASPTPPLISIRVLKSNGTAVAEPLDINLATDYMYSLRVETFSLTGWKLVNESRLPANITSHQANSCASKRFNSLYVTGLLSANGVDLVGVAGTSSLMTVSDTIDLSSNKLRTVANVTFSARRIDLSNNQLIQLPNVVYRPGRFCGAVVTGLPTVLLRRNQLSPKALDNLSGQRFSGLDLAENPSLLKASVSESSIYVSEFLDLSGLWGSESELSSLLTHFRHFDQSASVASTSRRFRLSLADNWLPNLATAVELVDEFLRNGDGSNRSLHLDISGNPRLVHLNLSDLPTNLVASLTVRRLSHLHSASVRVDGDAAAAAMERLRRRGQRPSIDDLVALLYQRGSTLRLDAQPSDCCLRAGASELVCSFEGHSGSSRSKGGSVFCYGEEDSIDAYGYGYGRLPHPPELPLLFSCVVLGGALLLGLVTGVAFFYARRRSRGKYAVYSAYDVEKLKSLQQPQPPPHQLASVGRNHVACGADPNGRPVLLKAVSVVQLPMESTASTNATHL